MATLTATTLLLFAVTALLLSLHITEAQTVGVSYGMLGNNLPSPQDVVNLYKSNGIKSMRLYYPDKATLQALQNTNIKLMLGVPNENIQSIASSQCAATSWTQSNVIPYKSVIKYITVGNEIEPSDQQASSVAQAMQNIHNALIRSHLNDKIKISTPINLDLITNSYPPSNGQFKNLSYISPIIEFLKDNNSPLMVNIYPYFAYINDPKDISVDYALFNTPNTVFTDPGNGLDYKNLFDAMVDAVYAALREAGVGNPCVVVSETGWPSAGGMGATMSNARTYYRNVINHVNHGTPLTQGRPIETYLFAMFNENQKQGAATERNFGLFYPNKSPKYGKLYF